MKAAEEFAKYLSETGYHPRSSKHGDRLCELLLEDLLEDCPAFRRASMDGTTCYNQNHPPGAGVPLAWNIDLAIGPSPFAPSEILGTGRVPIRSPPKELWIAVDAKTIMTEHGKARRNRQRDLNAFASILHMNNPKTIVCGLAVINIASNFRSPLRDGEVTIHSNVTRLVAECVQLFQDLPRAPTSGPSQGSPNQIDAMGVIVVEYTNVRGEPARLVAEPPAPQPGTPLHYASFVRDICGAFSTRFAP